MSKTDRLSLGDRMKSYERVWTQTLPMRMPLIIRLDGKAFHSYTTHAEKPFDDHLMKVLDETTQILMKEISGAMIAYVQSDEVSILVNSYRNHEELPWFANELPKILSVSAGMMSAHFTAKSYQIWQKNSEMIESIKKTYPEDQRNGVLISDLYRPAVFDSRAFVMPENDVSNYFLWRQRDCIRNSVNTVAREYFSQKQLFKKSTDEVKKMLLEKDVDLDDQEAWEPYYTRGRCIFRTPSQISDNVYRNVLSVDRKIPVFSENRDYINRFLSMKDE